MNVNINGFIWIYGVFELASTIFLSKIILKNTILVSLFLMLSRLENQGICLVMISCFKIFSINVTKAMFGLSRWYIGPNNLLYIPYIGVEGLSCLINFAQISDIIDIEVSF